MRFPSVKTALTAFAIIVTPLAAQAGGGTELDIDITTLAGANVETNNYSGGSVSGSPSGCLGQVGVNAMFFGFTNSFEVVNLCVLEEAKVMKALGYPPEYYQAHLTQNLRIRDTIIQMQAATAPAVAVAPSGSDEVTSYRIPGLASCRIENGTVYYSRGVFTGDARLEVAKVECLAKFN